MTRSIIALFCATMLFSIFQPQPINAAPVSDTTRIDELERKVEVLADELEAQKIGKAYVRPDQSVAGLGPAASKIYTWEPGISFGGYGELKARLNLQNSDDVFDLQRLVLYTGYKFNDKWLLNAEIEFEHVFETEVEFAYLDYLARQELKFRVGHLLVPVGIFNELHEPTTFWSVDRPEVEKRIIPTTWHENGVGLYGDIGPLAYKAYLMAGFDAEQFGPDDNGVRSIRQEGAKAKFHHPASALRLDYKGISGLNTGLSGYAGNAAQTLKSGGKPIDAAIYVYDGHFDWHTKGFGLRALAAFVSIPDAVKLNKALGFTAPDDTVAKFMYGTYIETGYDVLTGTGLSQQSLTPFFRYSKMNTRADVPAGFNGDGSFERQLLTAGVDYKPIDQITFKMDYKNTNPTSGKTTHFLNFAAGYIF